MTVSKELCAAQRRYTDNNGQEKTVWLKVGEIHTSSEGREYMVLFPHINLAGLPRKDGDDRLFVSMFDPKPRDGRQQQQRQQAPQSRQAPPSNYAEDFSDDIPF